MALFQHLDDCLVCALQVLLDQVIIIECAGIIG